MSIISTAKKIGTKIGQSLAAFVLATPDVDLDWTGITDADGDQLTAAGIHDGTPEWDAAVVAAREAYESALSDRRH